MDVLFVSDLSVDQPSISFYNVANGVQLKCLKNSSCQRNGYAFVNNDVVLVAQHNKQLIHIYDTSKDQLIKRIVCPGKISCLEVSTDGCYCIVALVEKIYIWQLATGDLINILTKHYQKVNTIRFTNDGSFFVTCGDDGLVLVWNLASVLQPIDSSDPENTNGQPFQTITVHSLAVKDIYISMNGNRSVIVSASSDQTSSISDLSSGELICQMTIGACCCAVTMDILESHMYIGTKNGKIYIINLQDQGQTDQGGNGTTNHIEAHNKEINSLSVSMDSNLLVSSSLDGNVKLWDVESKQCLKIFSFKGEVTNARFLRFPVFLNEKYQPPKFLTPISNFKRSVTIPSNKVFQAESIDDLSKETTPVILKDIHNSGAYKFLHNNDIDGEMNAAFQVVMKESNFSNVPSRTFKNDLQHASRKELLQKIDDFKEMSNSFYVLAKDKLINMSKDLSMERT